MTPLQLAKDECANMNPDGSCTGANINDDLEHLPCNPAESCAIAEGKPCVYFEEIIMPMLGMTESAARVHEIQEAVDLYRRAHCLKPPASRQCPDCGGAIQPRRRYCPACASARRKATFRLMRRKSGLGCNS